MKAQDSHINNDFCLNLSYLPKPSLTQAINFYHAYNSFGPGYASALACTSLGDGFLSTMFEGRNYLSLTAFWGNIAYKAVSQVQNSSHVLPTYKIPLSLLFTSIAAGMVWKGKDIFEEKQDLTKTVKALKLTAGFFDEQGIMSELLSEFNKGYIEGITYGVKNAPSLVTNKFVSYTFLGQVLYFANSYLIQKIFNNIPQTGQLAIFLQLKGGKGIADIIKSCLIEFCKSMVQFAYNETSKKLSGSVKNEIDQKVAEIALKEGNSEMIIKLGDAINKFPDDINEASTLASRGFSSLSEALFFNQLFGLKTHSGESFYDKYPTLVLLEAITRSLLGGTNIWELKNYLYKMIFGEQSVATVGVENICIMMGVGTTNTIIKTTDYTYQNIQEIVKLGGNEFMISKIIKFLENQQTLTNYGCGKDFLSITLTSLQNLISDFAFAAQLPVLQLSDSDMQDVLGKLINLTALFQETQFGNISCSASPDIDRAISTLSSLQTPETNGVNRILNSNFTLSLNEYHLKKTMESKDMIYIPDLNLTSGKVYAISGVIGTGKTTLLTDVAKCMISVFLSSGTIKYPVYHDENGQHEVPIIFCGTEPFSPPATTLLERVTYRIPEKYRLDHKDELLSKAMELFKSFGQDGFSEEKFVTVGNNDKIGLSTGQGKLVILVAAILYKQYLNSPVLFVIDETLANLDIGTSSKVCSKIKEVFNDSLVLSVDHNYGNNTEFYSKDNVIDLSQYKPKDEVVAIELSGDVIITDEG